MYNKFGEERYITQILHQPSVQNKAASVRLHFASPILIHKAASISSILSISRCPTYFRKRRLSKVRSCSIGISKATAYRMADQSRIPCIRLGKRIILSKSPYFRKRRLSKVRSCSNMTMEFLGSPQAESRSICVGKYRHLSRPVITAAMIDISDTSGAPAAYAWGSSVECRQ